MPRRETKERVLEFVRRRLLGGLPPTVREVQAALGFQSSATAREHLERLIAEGRLARAPGLSRGLRLPGYGAKARDQGRPGFPIPLLGRVQAGAFALAAEDIEGYVWSAARYPPGELFALRVRGESMTGAGLLPGDVVIVHRQPEAESGQIVVALVDDEATVKTLRRRRSRIELHPSNPAFPVLSPDPARLRILGRVVEARRSYEEEGGRGGRHYGAMAQ